MKTLAMKSQRFRPRMIYLVIFCGLMSSAALAENKAGKTSARDRTPKATESRSKDAQKSDKGAGTSAVEPSQETASSEGALSAESILEKADEIRNPSSTYKMEVSVESTNESTFRFEINIGGKDSSLIRTLEPSREVGKNYLMLNENMWAYIPNIKRSIRVTLNQKLTGQAANGDISRMRWHGDYDAKIESENTGEWVLFLTAKKAGLTYDKIRVSIDKKTFRPVHGEYLTTQGKLLKKIQFVEYAAMAGAIRPIKMVLTNAQKEGDQSTLRILKMAESTFPSNFFTEGNLQ
jgi:outer membrane lipoprotein-sorting protein